VRHVHGHYAMVSSGLYTEQRTNGMSDGAAHQLAKIKMLFQRLFEFFFSNAALGSWPSIFVLIYTFLVSWWALVLHGG